MGFPAWFCRTRRGVVTRYGNRTRKTIFPLRKPLPYVYAWRTKRVSQQCCWIISNCSICTTSRPGPAYRPSRAMCTNGLPFGLIPPFKALVITLERLQSSCYKSITTKRSSGFPTKLIDFCDYHRKLLYLKMASNKEVVREGRLTTKGQWKRLNYFALI